MCGKPYQTQITVPSRVFLYKEGIFKIHFTAYNSRWCNHVNKTKVASFSCLFGCHHVPSCSPTDLLNDNIAYCAQVVSQIFFLTVISAPVVSVHLCTKCSPYTCVNVFVPLLTLPKVNLFAPFHLLNIRLYLIIKIMQISTWMCLASGFTTWNKLK